MPVENYDQAAEQAVEAEAEADHDDGECIFARAHIADIRQGGPSVLRSPELAGRALLLVWPYEGEAESGWDAEALHNFSGDIQSVNHVIQVDK
eukprot:COSAG05_NODE_1152_length_5703_cov_5.326374_3_plen_93_part_00